MKMQFLLLALISLAAHSSIQARSVAAVASESSSEITIPPGRARLLAFASEVALVSGGPPGELGISAVDARTLRVRARGVGTWFVSLQMKPRPGSRAQEVRLFKIIVAPTALSKEAAARLERRLILLSPESSAPRPVSQRAAPTALLWALEGLGDLKFTSLSARSLRAWVQSLPEGSSIRWQKPLEPFAVDRFAVDRELASFAKFCASVGVGFVGPRAPPRRLEPQLFQAEE